ncbi:tkl tkl-ccin protein kinase [Moniliophthora roreri]|nr:tkl tkl-ccin protein kinase [Moniliophthora roreri]KAI3605307.1 tkl tkl-ccin protein kinase [Moniliophthora roreri]KAI3605316.1 tkl tkl-ccin protein kinase [Moniliophthora roreri]
MLTSFFLTTTIPLLNSSHPLFLPSAWPLTFLRLKINLDGSRYDIESSDVAQKHLREVPDNSAELLSTSCHVVRVTLLISRQRAWSWAEG